MPPAAWRRRFPLPSTDYLELVDNTGREIREDKRGYISSR